MARIFELTTPLGPDVLLFRSLNAREELGRLSEFDVSAVSTRGDIKPGDLLGKGVTVKRELRGGGHRCFHGHVVRFEQGAMVGRYYGYRLMVRPWPWFMTRTSDCRIFQNMTVPDIIRSVFDDHAAAYKFELTGHHATREYCVQYRETDFDFVSRLMEEEGIYYFFEHADGQHNLKVVDSTSAHESLEKAIIAYYPPGQQVRVDEEFIHSWTFEQAIKPGLVELDDYDFTKPRVELAVKAKIIEKHALAEYEVFDWPGEYQETADGEYLVRARVDELHSEFDRAEAECNVREITVGRLFTLTNGPRQDQEREYLIVSAEYDLHDNAYETSAEEPTTYHARFTVLHTGQQFRPARLTPRPTVKGVHSAVVVGPAGEEIWTDKYGRVKVQFHWDRRGKMDENSSCWIRVSHPWAGGTWGAVALPRIGQEVIVDFLEGDPDQPIIIGRVYNADQMPPYALPANKTQSGVKSRSSLNGGPANFNEIRFEDKKGSEQLFIHAEKNQDIEVENDETHWVGHDRTKTIDHDETTHVKHDRTETVDNNETITVHANRTEMVDMNEIIAVGLTRTRTVGVNEMVTIGAAQEVTVGAVQVITVGAAQVVTVGSSQQMTIGDSRTTGVGEDDSLSVGKNLVINAGDSITIKVGAASITMKKDGTIQIKGKDITISGSGDISGKAGGNMTLKAQKILQN